MQNHVKLYFNMTESRIEMRMIKTKQKCMKTVAASYSE